MQKGHGQDAGQQTVKKVSGLDGDQNGGQEGPDKAVAGADVNIALGRQYIYRRQAAQHSRRYKGQPPLEGRRKIKAGQQRYRQNARQDGYDGDPDDHHPNSRTTHLTTSPNWPQ